MTFNSKDNQIDNLTARMGLSGPKNSAEVFKREDFDSDDAYCEACARRDLALEKDPRLGDLKRRYQIQLEAERQKKLEEEAAAHYAEIRENVRLSADEKQKIDDAATVRATEDLRAGRIEPQQFSATKAKHAEQMEKAQLDNKACGQSFNEFIRSEMARNRVSGNA